MLPEPEILTSFLLASISLTLLPGPDNLFVLSQSALHGSRAGIPSALGMAAGNFIHTLAIALGLSALVTATPILFSMIKFLGIAYLLYLAWQSWQHPLQLNTSMQASPSNPQSSLSLFKRGALMNILNPKVALFFLAFFPQFIDQSSEYKAQQIFILGTVFVIQTAIIFSIIALAAGRLQPLLQRMPPRYIAGITSAVFILLSLYLLIGIQTG